MTVWLCIAILLFPVEVQHAVDIQECDDNGDEITEDRFHPVAHLHTGTGIGFCKEFIPAPSKLVAAEQSKYQRAKRQCIIGNEEIPQIKPRGTF